MRKQDDRTFVGFNVQRKVAQEIAAEARATGRTVSDYFRDIIAIHRGAALAIGSQSKARQRAVKAAALTLIGEAQAQRWALFEDEATAIADRVIRAYETARHGEGKHHGLADGPAGKILHVHERADRDGDARSR